MNRENEMRQNPYHGDREEDVRNYLEKLLAVSRDPDYDRYLKQMIKDLESGKASPFQVRREAEKTKQQTPQRMR